MPLKDLDPALVSSIVDSPAMNESTWSRALRDHFQHDTFHSEDWPVERCVGFCCSCQGDNEELVWMIPISTLKMASQEVQNALQFVRAREKVSPLEWHETRMNRIREMQEVIRLAEVSKKKLLLRYRKRAMRLLEKHLTPQQLRQFKRKVFFTVVARDGKTYRIENGSSGNVFLMEGRKKVIQYCIVFKDHAPLPNFDLMLAQKLILETDQELFLKTANATDLRAPRPNTFRIEEIPPLPEGFQVEETGVPGLQVVRPYLQPIQDLDDRVRLMRRGRRAG